jgi:hypothetical protein
LLYLHLVELARSRQADLWREAEHARLVASATSGAPARDGCLMNLVRRLSGVAAPVASVVLRSRTTGLEPAVSNWDPCHSSVPPVQRYPWGPPV